MAKLFASLVALSMVLSAGCVVRTRGGGGPAHRTRTCGPAHHWNGQECVHNGRKRGHHKHKHDHRKHRR